MKIGFNEATALKCEGQSLMADLEMCEKYGFDYFEIRYDCIAKNTFRKAIHWKSWGMV